MRETDLENVSVSDMWMLRAVNTSTADDKYFLGNNEILQ